MADELVVHLRARDELTGRFTAATRATEAMTHALDGSRSSMLQMGAAMGVASAAANKLMEAAGAALNAIGNAAIGLNSRLEQANIAFTTMLGSGEKAAAFLKDLQAFAATTPFEFPQLVEASKRMLAFGFAAEQVKPLLTAVGNAAAAMGSGAEGINRMTTALGQMQAKGKVTAEEMMQLTESGIPAWQMLADVLGTDVAGAMAAVEKRTVDAATMIEAFQTGVGARFGNMMAEQAKTLQGAWSTVTDSLQMAIANGFKPLFDVLSELMQAAAAFLQSATFEQWAQGVATAMGAAVRAAQAWISDVGPKLMSTLDAVGGAFLKLAEPLIRLEALWSKAAADFVDFITQMGAATTDSGTVITDALSTLGAAFDTFIAEPLAAAADFYEAAWGRMRAEVEIAYQQVRPLLDDLGQYLGSVLPPILEALGQAWQTVWQAIQDIGATTWDVLRPVFEGLGNWLGETGPQAVDFFRSTWSGFWDNVGPALAAAWGNIQPVLEAVGQWLGENIPRALATARQAWDQFWSTVRPILEAIGKLIGQTFDFIGTKVHEGVVVLTEEFAAAAPKVQQSAQVMAAAAEDTAESYGEMATAATEMAAETTKASTQATTAAPRLAAIGTAAASAVPGLRAATEAASDLKKQLETSTNRTVIQGILEQQNALKVIEDGIRKASTEWAAYIIALRNANDISGALAAAQRALGISADELRARLDGTEDAFKAAQTAATAYAQAIENDARQATERAIVTLRHWGGSINRELANAIEDGSLTVAQAVERMVQRAIADNPAMAAAGEEMGRDIMAGLERGIPAGAQRATGVITDNLHTMVQRSRDFLRARSPSQLFAEEVGKPIPEGIAEGIRSGTSLVVDAFGHLRTAMDSGLQRLQSGTQAALSVLNRGFSQALSGQQWGDLLGRPSGDPWGDAYRRLAGQSFQQLMQMAPPDVATRFQIENPTLFLGGMRETPTQDDVADLARRIVDAQRIMPQGGGGRGGLAEIPGGGASVTPVTRSGGGAMGGTVWGTFMAGTGGAQRLAPWGVDWATIDPSQAAEHQRLAQEQLQRELHGITQNWASLAANAVQLRTSVESTIAAQNVYSGALQKASVAVNDWSRMGPLGGGGAISQAQAQGQTLGSRVWWERFGQAVHDVEQMGLPFGADVGKAVSKQLAKSYPEYAQQVEDMAYLEIPALSRAHDEATQYLNSMSDAYRQGLASADAVADAQARVAAAADALAAAQASAARRVATSAAPAAAAAAERAAAPAASYTTTTTGSVRSIWPTDSAYAGVVPSFQHGGIMRGTGLALLHGPEAVIPLGGTGTSPYNSWAPTHGFVLPGSGGDGYGGGPAPAAPPVVVQVEYNPTFGASTAGERQQAALEIVKYIIPELRRRGF